VSGSSVTGSDAYGVKYYPGITPPPAARFNNDWTYGGCTGGIDGVYGNITSTTQWAYIGTYNGNCSGGLRMICIEDVDNAVLDTTPNTILAPYKVQVATSSRQSSSAWVISGMSSGATTTIGVSGSSGSPTFTVNGGAEVTSAAGVKNGDSLVFKMDAPATGNSNNKMTITANSGADIIGYWRVWTGDTTGTKVKRIFIGFSGSVLAGVTSYDTACNSNASSAGLGGTWKAVISGISESEYAVNRVGYDWTTLRRVDGTDVALSGNLWNTASVPLLSTVSLRANGATYSATSIVSNTSSAGMAKSVTASDNPGSCNNWGTNSSGMAAFDGTSGSNTTAWIEDGSPDGSNCYYCCGGGQYFYCMEQ